MSAAPRKRCQICNKLFTPNPRLTSSRQIACSRPQCQKARKKANQDDWLSRHPDYFKGRYWNTKRWLDEHPGYLAGYRKDNPEKVACDNERRRVRRQKTTSAVRADIQDSLLAEDPPEEELTIDSRDPARADIQDSLLAQVLSASLVAAYLAMRRYTRLDRSGAAPLLPSPARSAGVAPDDDSPG